MPPSTLLEFVNKALDQQYTQTAGRVITAIGQELRNPKVNKAITELINEARRLRAAGELLHADNPQMVRLLREVDLAVKRGAGAMGTSIEALETQAAQSGLDLTRELAIRGAGRSLGAEVSVVWNAPNPAAVRELITYADSAAWAEQLAGLSQGVVDTLRNQAILGMARGRNPVATARDIRRIAQTLPAHQANTLMRTLQLQSYRTAAAEAQLVNTHILEYQVRMAALDDRTCLACIWLSGERLPLGQRIDDHHNGRCFGVPVVRGSTLTIPRGEDWLNGLSEKRRSAIYGPSNYRAVQDGAARLEDFVREYQDDVFGRMVTQDSLKGVLGDAAGDYYTP